MKRGPGEFEKWWETTLTETLGRTATQGILDNWREFLFFRRTHHPFLRPTYFSLFGLLNLQRAGKSVQLSQPEFWAQIHALLRSNAAWEDIHHFSNPDNFCIDNGQLQILDYGSLLTQKAVRENGLAILEGFNLDPK